ncbi:nitric oxide synthase oxygenase [Oceanobacillus sojae]|uniref:Nitric oxide synthase oxygenase n=2 Tax=Oceanobacillus sojae TaxID=582851 RepID=A0A511ZJV7_9BACI|nr:nitric oxide synthase oxygenase [Oceanobacillus sojae]GEN87705.1 nitric oxide synthase oxygenase [Oceanobacillus sojae]
MNNYEMQQEAEQFLKTYYTETGAPAEKLEERMKEVISDIKAFGTYTQTYDEIVYGVKLAWRNSNRCIGRLFWERIDVADARQAATEEEVFEFLFSHLKNAFNQGRIKPYITIFPAVSAKEETVKVWNHQLLRYAGYDSGEGIIGDSDSLEFTRICEKLGWQGKGTDFDILPLVIQIGDQPPVWRSIPEALIPEIPMEHPEYKAVADLHLKWYAIPIIADMRLEIGGLHYVSAPFNGWYMGTEIGARNFADEHRYNLLPKMAEIMGLETKHASNLWQDRALIELNEMVLHSFKKQGVSIVDHHTAAAQFRIFEKQEAKAEREVTGKWTWLIPPVSPATTHVWHQPYSNELKKPNFFYQDKAYQEMKGCPFHR